MPIHAFMINRRFLRTQVMQSLYGLQVDLQTAIDVAMAKFDEDLFQQSFNASEPQEQMLEKKENAHVVFQMLKNQAISNRSPALFQEDVRPLAATALAFALEKHKAESTRKIKLMHSNLSFAFDSYIALLLLAAEFPSQLTNEVQVNEDRYVPQIPLTFQEQKLARNPTLLALATSKELQTAAIRLGISWEKKQDEVKTIYLEGLKKTKRYTDYIAEEETDENHFKFFKWLGKNFLFANQTVEDIMEERSSYWAELKQATAQLFTETIKRWPANADEPLVIFEKDAEFDSDFQFMKSLYTSTIDSQANTDLMVAQVVEKWDMNRIAMVDLIIIQMAVAEFVSLADVPIKTTMNEYLEIAKIYSTPDSSKFINGILDKVAKQMQAQKLIKKSAKGLIDVA